MIVDERTELASALAINTGAPGLYALGDVIDTTNHQGGVDVGLWLVLAVATAFESAGAASVRFHLASDAQGAIATDGSATLHFSTAAIPVAALVAGYRIAAFQLPPGMYERYLGVMQETITAAFTAGRINVFLTSDPALYRTYGDNVA